MYEKRQEREYRFTRKYVALILLIVCICVSCRIIKNDSKWDYVKLAVAMFASVLALPTLVVLYGVIFYIVKKKHSWNNLVYFVITSILCGLMALGLLGLVGGKLSYLINLTKDGFHEVSVVKFIRGLLLLGIIIFLVFIVDILLSKVLDKGMRLKVVTCISGVLAIGVCLVTSQLSQLMRVCVTMIKYFCCGLVPTR